jgi:cytoskeletal protein RodZ
MSFSATLSPVPNDISIDALSTSLPHLLPLQQKVSGRQSENSRQGQRQQPVIPVSEQEVDLSHLMPEDWPELQYVDTSDNDDLENAIQSSDPLKARQLPVYKPLTHQERREKYSDISTVPASVPVASFSPASRHVSVQRRVMYLVFVVAIILTLFVGSIFISHNLTSRPSGKALNTPMITAMPTNVHPGMQVLVQLSHFSASTNVYLTHDLQEMVRTDIGTSLVPLGKTGSREVHIFVDSSWGAGEHTLEAEDVTTRYTTTTTIQVIGAGPVRPTQLVVSQATLNMGADLQGANSIQSLTLHNSGDGTISWVASSNQPWLLFTPMQGIFSRDEQMSVAVTRANLAPGNNYHGTITIQSSANPPLTVQVTMAVLPLPAHPSIVLEVTPSALSFTAVDGVSSPPGQALTIHNAGTNALSWAFTSMTSVVAQNTTPTSNADWLNIVPRTGVVAPGASMEIRVQLAGQSLLPGIYNDILTFSSLNGGYDTPQHVAVSLIYRQNMSTTSTSSNTPSSGTATVGGGITATATSSPGQPVLAPLPSQMSFSSTQGQADPASQNVAITNTGGSALQWQASIPTSAQSWLTMSSQAGTVAAGQTVQVALSVHATQLAIGTYNTQVTVNATNSAGIPVQNSPQLLNVTLTVSAPCTLQVTPGRLAFTATLLQPDPPGQTITLSETGNCVRPVSWQASVDHSWVALSSTNGSNGGTITVYISSSGMLLGTYTANITLSAVDKNGAGAQNSPQTVSITLTVLG